MVVKKRKSSASARDGKYADAPWKRKPPPKSAHKHLPAKAKAKAKAAAKRAGRPYPNLIDNMRAAAALKR